MALELAALSLCLGLLPSGANATRAAGAEVTQLLLERDADGVFLSATVQLELPALVEDALLKGIPMYFEVEAELSRERWYWYDKKVAGAVRHMRLAYQPLTRRWRLNVSAEPIDNVGLGVALNQNFDSLSEAIEVMQRLSRWKIAEASEVEPGLRYSASFRFRLDASRLPRPFQIGVLGPSDWNISASRTLSLKVEDSK